MEPCDRPTQKIIRYMYQAPATMTMTAVGMETGATQAQDLAVEGPSPILRQEVATRPDICRLKPYNAAMSKRGPNSIHFSVMARIRTKTNKLLGVGRAESDLRLTRTHYFQEILAQTQTRVQVTARLRAWARERAWLATLVSGLCQGMKVGIVVPRGMASNMGRRTAGSTTRAAVVRSRSREYSIKTRGRQIGLMTCAPSNGTRMKMSFGGYGSD